MIKAKDLKAYETANRTSIYIDSYRSEMYFMGAISEGWIMAEDKSHEYKIDRVMTKSDELAVVLAVNHYAILESRDDGEVIMQMKRIY